MVPHLRRELGVFLRELGQDVGFVNRVRQGLLRVNMLAEPKRRGRDNRVRVVGRGADHGVDVLELVKHHAEVIERLGGLMHFQRTLDRVVVDIAEGDNTLLADFAVANVASTHPAATNDRDVELLVGGIAVHGTSGGKQTRPTDHRGRLHKELAAIRLTAHVMNSPSRCIESTEQRWAKISER